MTAARPSHPAMFGRYRVARVLGEGAMGTVFVAEDAILGREVAIKSIQPFALRLDGKARFLNEARAVAGLTHPNVVQVFDVGEDNDVPFLVMEIARGGSLRMRLERDGRLPPAEVRALGIQIAHALSAAHARNIVHRDVKPANILEGEPGTWKLADFGVAHVPDSRLTITGQFLGSPAYAAPESIVAGVFGPTSDVYALACTLYEAATGAGPHDHCGLETRLGGGEVAAPVHEAALRAIGDPELAAAILRALARDFTTRPSATQLATMLAGGSAVLPPAPAEQGRVLGTPSPGPGAVAALETSIRPPDRTRKAVAIAACAILIFVLGALATRSEAPSGGAAVRADAGRETNPTIAPGESSAFGDTASDHGDHGDHGDHDSEPDDDDHPEPHGPKPPKPPHGKGHGHKH